MARNPMARNPIARNPMARNPVARNPIARNPMARTLHVPAGGAAGRLPQRGVPSLQPRGPHGPIGPGAGPDRVVPRGTTRGGPSAPARRPPDVRGPRRPGWWARHWANPSFSGSLIGVVGVLIVITVGLVIAARTLHLTWDDLDVVRYFRR